MELCNINHIKPLLARHGFHFSKSMGQNFLIAPWVPQQIAEGAGLDENTGVLEIGPGIGCLTEQLSKRAGKVLAIELDKGLENVLGETLSEFENIKVIFGDALKLDLKKLAAEEFGTLKPVVCANLPYNVTSPLISAFLEAGCFDSMTIMVQREVARRICSVAGESDYGAFTVYVNWYAETEILFDVSPSCFVPRPKVWSSVIKLRSRKAPPAQVSDEALFFRIVRAAFNQRRKTLANALSAGLPEITKEEILKAMELCGMEEKVRGEVLDIKGFAELTNEISKMMA
ncbi:MAG: 16S rRNA (adenine(1518)-N(6)/adenine(1519)-N(6))-dimethyltransferase RsmA [Clostridiales bacterium]|nr:16S rRNA (adenine(1518)-N(6)/adenine(1519)-N(6))-dimethyltransferase RsmA [Clostridiales bacterium]